MIEGHQRDLEVKDGAATDVLVLASEHDGW